MKQRLKNIKKSNLIIAAIILLVAVIALSFGISFAVKRAVIVHKLNLLRKETQENDELLIDKYDDADISEDEKQTVRDLLNGAILRNGAELLSLDDVKEILKEYPTDYDSALERPDIYVVAFGFPMVGITLWDNFVADCRIGRAGSIVMAQFSGTFDCTYYYIEYNGSSFHVVEDRSSDSEDAYSESFGKYLNIEDYEGDAGYAEYGFLTDDQDLTYKDIDNYINAEDTSYMEEPQYWQFYIGVVTDEMTESTMRSEDAAQYTGFCDKSYYYAKDNPCEDYDGDGILDRVYREYVTSSSDKSSVNVYMMLGNGNTITLAKNIWGSDIKTFAEDVTGDGEADICFMQSEGDEYEIMVYEYRNGNYGILRNESGFTKEDFETLK